MLYPLIMHTKLIIKRFIKNEKGEGMVGWIAGALLTVTIVTIMHGLITGWLTDFWNGVETKIEDIVA